MQTPTLITRLSGISRHRPLQLNEPSSIGRIANLEDGLTERKRGFQSNDEIRKAVVSFASSVPEGHTPVLFIGVANGGTVTGV
jgi:hypothetical protein